MQGGLRNNMAQPKQGKAKSKTTSKAKTTARSKTRIPVKLGFAAPRGGVLLSSLGRAYPKVKNDFPATRATSFGAHHFVIRHIRNRCALSYSKKVARVAALLWEVGLRPPLMVVAGATKNNDAALLFFP